jgi:hypothetical protein
MGGAFFFGFRGRGAITYVDLRPGWCRGPEGPVRVPHARWAAGEAGCRGKSWLAPHSTGSAMAERLSSDPNPHTRGGLRGLTLGDPDRSGLRCSGCVFRKWGRGPCAFPHRR